MSIKSMLRQVVKKNYPLACLYQKYQFNKSPNLKKEPVIVYQMGKVGSSSIVKSLETQLPQMSIYKIHYMNTHNIRNMERQCKKLKLPWRHHILAAKYFNRLIKQGLDQRLKVITLVRDPVAKNISQFFQSIDVAFPEFRYQEKVRSMRQLVFIEELVDFFLEKFPHDDPIVWFDEELKAMLNIDVFSQEFPRSQGYDVYQGKHADMLLMRLEDLNRCAADAIKTFLALSNFELINTNISKGKEYADIYELFKDAIKGRDDYLDRMYSSRYATHFYSSKELDQFRKKWTIKKMKAETYKLKKIA